MGQLLRGSGQEITGQLGKKIRIKFTALPSRTLPESRQTDSQNGRDRTGLQVSPRLPPHLQRWGRGAGLSCLSLQPSSRTQNSKKGCGKRRVTPNMSVG